MEQFEKLLQEAHAKVQEMANGANARIAVLEERLRKAMERESILTAELKELKSQLEKYDPGLKQKQLIQAKAELARMQARVAAIEAETAKE